MAGGVRGARTKSIWFPTFLGSSAADATEVRSGRGGYTKTVYTVKITS